VIDEILNRQYGAALEMLERAVMACPEEFWASEEYPNRFWHVAYHAAFFTHLYLHPSLDEFRPWAKCRQHYQFLGGLPWAPEQRPVIDTPYTKPELLELIEFCRGEIAAKLPAMDFDARSGFPWLPFTRLEVQIYSIRHTQHHVGQLVDRLRTARGTASAWVVGK